MSDDATRQAILSAVRSLLIVAGTGLIGHVFTDATVLNEAVGAIMVLLTAGWAILDKYRAEHVTQAREAVAVQAGLVAAKDGVEPSAVQTKSDAQKLINTYLPPN